MKLTVEETIKAYTNEEGQYTWNEETKNWDLVTI